MRVSAIDLYTSDVEFISVNLSNPSVSDKYQAKVVIGLDADELNPRFYGFGAVAGDRYHEYTRKVREIVMRIVLNPNYQLNERYSDIRDDFYRAISGNRSGEIKLVLRSGASSVAQIYGRIVKLEVPHFSKIPELQVTLRCDDPIFRGISPVEMERADIAASAANTIEFTDAISTAPHGFTLATTVTTGVTGFTLRALDDDWVFDVDYALVAGDVLTLSTEYGAKSLSVLRSAVTTNLMDKVSIDSFWPVIFPGFNEWRWDDFANFGTTTLSYKTAFWGV